MSNFSASKSIIGLLLRLVHNKGNQIITISLPKFVDSKYLFNCDEDRTKSELSLFRYQHTANGMAASADENAEEPMRKQTSLIITYATPRAS